MVLSTLCRRLTINDMGFSVIIVICDISQDSKEPQKCVKAQKLTENYQKIRSIRSKAIN